MHISSHILKEQVHFQSRVCELFLAAYTAFSSQVAIARHPYIHVGQCCGGSGVLFTCFGLRSDGAALVWPCPRISQGSALPIGAILPGSLASLDRPDRMDLPVSTHDPTAPQDQVSW